MRRKWSEQNPNFIGTVDTLEDLADLHTEMQQFDIAEEELNEALAICNNKKEEYEYSINTLTEKLAVLQRIQSARRYTEEELQRCREQVTQEGELRLARMLTNLATLHHCTKQHALAEQELDEAAELFSRQAEVEEEDVLALASTGRLLKGEST